MKTKNYLIAFAIIGGLMFTAFNTANEEGTKIDRTPRKIVAFNSIDRTPRKIVAFNSIDRTPRKIVAFNSIDRTPRKIVA
tara:strand:- start:3042 stop:3281 length:240 start_codon:yes stop_codon:yes gene_type:complete